VADRLLGHQSKASKREIQSFVSAPSTNSNHQSTASPFFLQLTRQVIVFCQPTRPLLFFRLASSVVSDAPMSLSSYPPLLQVPPAQSFSSALPPSPSFLKVYLPTRLSMLHLSDGCLPSHVLDNSRLLLLSTSRSDVWSPRDIFFSQSHRSFKKAALLGQFLEEIDDLYGQAA